MRLLLASLLTALVAFPALAGAVPGLTPEDLASGLRFLHARGQITAIDLERLASAGGVRDLPRAHRPTRRCGTAALQAVRAWVASQGVEIRPALAPTFDRKLVSQDLPIEVFYSADSEKALADTVLAAAEQTWRDQVDEAGYRAPYTGGVEAPPTRGMRYYLAESEYWAGLTEPLADVAETPLCDCSTNIYINTWLGPDEAPMTVFHEFNHATQAATDCAESITAWENFATAVEFVLSGRADWGSFHMQQEFQRYPHFPIDFWTQGYGSDETPSGYYQYGASLFPLYLLDRFGPGDLRTLREIWETFAQEGTVTFSTLGYECSAGNVPGWFEGLDGYLKKKGSGLHEAFAEFSTWRAVVGSHDDGAHYVNGAHIPEPAVAQTHTKAPVSKYLSIHDWGTRFVELAEPAGFPPTVRVKVKGDAERMWDASLLIWRGSGREVQRLRLPFSGVEGMVDADLRGASRVLLAVSEMTEELTGSGRDSGTERFFQYSLLNPPSPPPQEEPKPEPEPVAPPEEGGCGCQTGAAAAPTLALAFAGALAVLARRRAR